MRCRGPHFALVWLQHSCSPIVQQHPVPPPHWLSPSAAPTHQPHPSRFWTITKPYKPIIAFLRHTVLARLPSGVLHKNSCLRSSLSIACPPPRLPRLPTVHPFESPPPVTHARFAAARAHLSRRSPDHWRVPSPSHHLLTSCRCCCSTNSKIFCTTHDFYWQSVAFVRLRLHHPASQPLVTATLPCL